MEFLGQVPTMVAPEHNDGVVAQAEFVDFLYRAFRVDHRPVGERSAPDGIPAQQGGLRVVDFDGREATALWRCG